MKNNISKIISFIVITIINISAINASTNDNLLKNGDFEDTNCGLFSYENDNYKNCPSLVAGWDLRTLGENEEYYTTDFNNIGLSKYNVRGQIVTDSLADVGGKQCIRIQRYEWTKATDNPTDGGLQQTVSVVPSTQYQFSFLYRLSNHTESSTIVPAWYSVSEISSNGIETVLIKQKKLYNEMDNKWYSLSTSFSTSDTAKSVKVKIGVTGGYVYSWGGNMSLWADFDNVSLTPTGTNGFNELNSQNNNININISGNTLVITNINIKEPLIVYDLTGRIIRKTYTSNTNATINLPDKGIYIISNGKTKNIKKICIK